MERKKRFTRREPTPVAIIRRRTDERRGSSHSRGYSHRWQDYRAGFLAENPFCIVCQGEANIIDHILPVNQDGSELSGSMDPLFWVPWNHQPVCPLHHRVKTDQHDARLMVNRRAIVTRLTIDESETAARRNELLRLAAVWREWLDLETGQMLRLF